MTKFEEWWNFIYFKIDNIPSKKGGDKGIHA